MRILIDARMMGAETSRGIGRYIEELVRAMVDAAPEHRYVLVTRRADHPFASHPSVETIVADIPWYGFAEQLRLGQVFGSAHADIVHVPHWNAPLSYRCAMVVTIHDLLLRHDPSSAKVSTRGPFVRLLKRAGYRLVLRNAIRRARRLLVPTPFVADDVRRLYPSAASKIVVTGEGMPALASKVESRKSKVGDNYLLYVGSAYPHKGLNDLLDAWSSISAAHPDLRLKIAGEMDAFMRRIRSESERLQLPRVEFLGRVSDERLAELYASAAAFVYPSHFEGFGLPPLEALAAGCPVISSDAGSLPEVLGKNGATFFRAGDKNAILAAVERVLQDPETARLQAVEAARELSKRHSWRTAAERTLEAYGHALHP